MRTFWVWIKLIWMQWKLHIALKALNKATEQARIDSLRLEWDKLDHDVQAPSPLAPEDELQDRFRRTDI